MHWRSIYDGQAIRSRRLVQIDHIVPLANAWRSGASRWTREQRVGFANDLTGPELVAVGASTNTAKGDRGPEDWKPPRQRVWCLHARWWIRRQDRLATHHHQPRRDCAGHHARALLADECSARARRAFRTAVGDRRDDGGEYRLVAA